MMAGGPQLGAFLSAAAGAAGVPPAAVSATTAVGSPSPAAVVVAPPTSSSGGDPGGFPIVIVAAVAGGAVLLIGAVAALVILQRRKSAVAAASTAVSRSGDIVSGTNPMRSARSIAAVDSGGAGAAASARHGRWLRDDAAASAGASARAAAFGTKQPRRWGSIRSVLGGPRARSDGMLSNPMHGGTGRAAAADLSPGSGHLHPKLGEAGVCPAQARHASPSPLQPQPGELATTANPMIGGHGSGAAAGGVATTACSSGSGGTDSSPPSPRGAAMAFYASRNAQAQVGAQRAAK